MGWPHRLLISQSIGTKRLIAVLASPLPVAAFFLDAAGVRSAPVARSGFLPMAESPPTLYAFTAPLLDGSDLSLHTFRGRVLLIVNTASQCGFTPQYAGLESLYRTYKDRGLTVLGFPCNQFGKQEPGGAEEIGAFCTRNYGVSFPIFSKIDVNGPRAHPLYKFLRKQKPGILGLVGASGIKWNFTKFLADRNGNVIARYGPSTEPKALVPAIERLLAQA
jgi:glutathione peroxidase